MVGGQRVIACGWRWRCGARLLLHDEDLRSNSLHLCDDVRLDEAIKVDATEAEETGLEDAAGAVEATEGKVGEVEGVKDTDLSELLEIQKLLEQEQVLELELVGIQREQVGEAVDIEVVLAGQKLEDLEVEAVDVEQVVQVDGLAEVVEVVESIDVEAERALLNLLLSSGGRGSQGGKGGNKESGRLHLVGCGSE